MVAIDAVDQVFVNKAFPVGAKAQEDGFSNILLFCLGPDDSLSFDDPCHETPIARNRRIEWVMILF